MEKIILAVDSACDIPARFLEENEITVLPFHITLGADDFIDGVTITRDVLYEKVEKTGLLPKTAAISPADFTDFFSSLLQKGDAVVYFSLGAKFSSACQNARLAAEDLNNVFVVDTASLSSGEALVLLRGAALRKEGKSAAEIAADCSAYAARCDASFVLDRLDYMHRGGRCSGVAALGANLLGIKPSLGVSEGSLGLEKKYRGKLKIVVSKYIRERLENVQAVPDYVFLTDAGVDPEVREAAYETLQALGIFKEIYRTDAGCVISSHCGPGTLGILFVRQ
ncbi:MAG: DegV family protein [Ruminococcaceae bacterium]|nr:DegV family protein [Oscillospiraceae bacterium]